MVRVKVYRTASGEIRSFVAAGHALYDDRGKDIVCAAVSILTQTAVNALEANAGVIPRVKVDKETGRLECVLPEGLGPREAERAQIVLESMVTGLRGIAREYKEYIVLKEVEK